MKLLICEKCADVFRLRYKQVKTCGCGESKGVYTSWTEAFYSGPCIPIGFKNDSFMDAIRTRESAGLGVEFTAFVIPSGSALFVHVDDVKEKLYDVAND